MSGRGRGGKRGAPPSASKLLLIRSVEESGLDDKNLKSLNDITKPALFPEMIWNIGMNGDHQSATSLNTGTGVPSSVSSSTVTNTTTFNSSSSSFSRTARSQSSTIYLINKGREIDHRIQTSSHWVRPSQTQVDVVRYQSDKKSHRFLDSQMPPDVAVLEQMGKNLAMNNDYIPSELIPSSYNNNNKNDSNNNRDINSRKRSLNGDIKNKNIKIASSTTATNDDDDENESTPNKPATLEELEKKEIERKKMEETKRANLLEENEANGNLSDIPPEDEEEEVEDYTMNYYASEDESDDDGGGGGGDAEATF